MAVKIHKNCIAIHRAHQYILITIYNTINIISNFILFVILSYWATTLSYILKDYTENCYSKEQILCNV